MTQPIRYAWVSNNRSGIRHRFYGKHFVEGERTQCGEYMRARWKFWYSNRDSHGTRVCVKCDSAMNRSSVK